MFAIGEASQRSGVGIEAIRYYEREGIVPKPERAANNRRQYTLKDVGRLRFLKQCRDLGFSLSDAKALLDLSDQRQTDCQEASLIAETHRTSVRKKIEELKRLDAALGELTSNCSKGNVGCPMLAKLQEA